MLPQLILIALATLASEDLTLAATGVLVSQGKISFTSGVAACAAGIFVGDIFLFLAGRAFGTGLGRWPYAAKLARRLAPPAHLVKRGADWLTHRGMIVVLLSRFTPGMRLPTYFAAGLLPTNLAAFAGYFFIAALLWTPLFVGATSWAGGQFFMALFGGHGTNAAALAAGLGVLGAGFWSARKLASSMPYPRRRFAGFIKRKSRWEFWPAWAEYLPLVPYLLYLAFRHRSTTLFTAANPGIPTGGFVGESKSQILRGLERESGFVAEFELIPGDIPSARRWRYAKAFAERAGWPVVLKPDRGERGMGVAIIRSGDELKEYLAAHPGDTIIQRFAPGLEFGIFYYRFPGEPKGRISSITEKRFPSVTGDGRRTLRELILQDDRAVCQAATYIQASRRAVDGIPSAGERVQLVELGTHCRGAIFLDGARHRSDALTAAVDRMSQALPGFYFGRFDIRTKSLDDLQAGRFLVVELNGVSGEAAHIYDPAVSIWEAYRTMFTHWRIAFEIGSANRKLGARVMPVGELVQAIRSRRAT